MLQGKGFTVDGLCVGCTPSLAVGCRSVERLIREHSESIYQARTDGSRDQGLEIIGEGQSPRRSGKVDNRLHGKGNSNSHGARPVY